MKSCNKKCDISSIGTGLWRGPYNSSN